MGDGAGVRELGMDCLRVREGGGSGSRILKKTVEKIRKIFQLSSNGLSRHEPVPPAIDLDPCARLGRGLRLMGCC
jgi:hypothetical protein